MDNISFQPKTVEQAKYQLLTVAANVDYLEPIKQYPIRCVVIAFSLGLVANKGSDSKRFLSPSLLSLIISTLRKL